MTYWDTFIEGWMAATLFYALVVAVTVRIIRWRDRRQFIRFELRRWPAALMRPHKNWDEQRNVYKVGP